MNAQDKEYIVPTVCITGWSGSGKTAFVESLIKNLVSKGYKIAALKHNAYNFQMDKPGKDSYRHKDAGASTVIISSSNKVAVIKDTEKEEEVIDLVNDNVDKSFDLVLVEGFKAGNLPKVEIYRPSLNKGTITNEINLIKRIVNDKNIEDLLMHVEEISEILIKNYIL